MELNYTGESSVQAAAAALAGATAATKESTGRVAKRAARGCITQRSVAGLQATCLQDPVAHHPEVSGKRPGYLSPSAGLKFTDVPSDLATISKVPATGWEQDLATRPPRYLAGPVPGHGGLQGRLRFQGVDFRGHTPPGASSASG
jgi:hypothetical protein